MSEDDDKPAIIEPELVEAPTRVPAFMRERAAVRTSLVDLAFRRLRNENTKRAYMGAWRRFAAFHGYETPGPLLGSLVHTAKADTIEMVHRWRDDMAENGLRPNTIAQGMRAISSVIDNLHSADAFPYTIKGLLEAPTPNRYTDVTGVPHDHWMRMLQAVTVEGLLNDDTLGLRGLRDTAVLLCLHDVMLRRFEVSKLRVEDWSKDKQEVRLIGKGRDDYEIMPVTRRTNEAIDLWLLARNERLRPADHETGPLFTHLPLSKEKSPTALTPEGIRYAVERIAQAAGVPGPISPHRLRHAGGTYLAKQGVAPDVLMRLMRHKSLETTMVYVRRASPEYAEALQKMEASDE